MALTTAILSNGSPEMLASAVKSAGMEDVLDHIISVDQIRLFKTSPESYGLVQKTISVNKDEVLFVSSNAWDALGATWLLNLPLPVLSTPKKSPISPHYKRLSCSL